METGGGDVSISGRPRKDGRGSRGSPLGSIRRSGCDKRLLSVLMVLVMVVVIVAPLSTSFTAGADYQGESHKVVYHLNAETHENGGTRYWVVDLSNHGNQNQSISVTDGENSTPSHYVNNLTVEVEYYGSEFSTEYNPQLWKDTFSPSTENWFEIKDYVKGNTIVFTGWSYGNAVGEAHYPGEIITSEQIEDLNSSDDGKIHIYATWGLLDNYETALANTNFTTGNVFTNVVEITQNDGAPISQAKGNFTLRGNNLFIWGADTLNGNVIIDGMSIQNRYNSNNPSNHGDGNGYGIFANGHTLVIGTGVDVTGDVTGSRDSSRAPQIYGGSNQGSCGSTNVIIHSGIFYNVVAGGYNCRITGDTNLVMRGGTVLDTVIGGNSGGDTNNNVIEGDTNVFMTGNVNLPGDEYEERQLDPNYKSGFDLTESTILTGGSNDGDVNGNTYVHISGDAKLWDVQGGGRRGSSVVGEYNGGSINGNLISGGTAHVYVSGKAVIKHVLCGSITDGIYSDSGNQCVKNVEMHISDSAAVASVFGAGYDTWFDPGYSSMYNGGDISISIDGGATVGYVYGGGYRGTVGLGPQHISDTSATKPLDSITISVSGNATVLGDVFGGGRGGLDKIKHNTDGTFNNGAGYIDSTGQSAVYVDQIDIALSGNATVRGSVYGGGESTPAITGQGDMSPSKSPTGVAKVVCDSIRLSVTENSTVSGDVYGAGKGVDVGDTTDGTHSSAFIFSIKMTDKGWQVVRMPWISGQSLTMAQGDYSTYASVQSGSISVDVSSNVEGSVYGAGMMGETTSNISLSLSGNISGDVYGGGYGRQDSFSTHSANRSIVVNGADIGGSVYGGSRYGDDNHDGSNLSRGTVTIYLVSGNIASGTSGNVYGGGYIGISNLDATILVGTATGMVPADDHLHVRSIFGGASVGEPSEDSNSQVLLQGDTRIEISNGFGRVYTGGFSISGDVFGAGDYCAIGGYSSIWIEDFIQSGSMLSVQKADVLRIIGSELVLDGNIDGNSTSGSEKLSLNIIGNLILQKSSERASKVTLNAAASQISGYSSFDYNQEPGNGDSVGDVPSFNDSNVTMNTIVLNEGMIMSILGTGDSGTDADGLIQGFTLLESDSRGYYGAFAVGVTKNVVVGDTGFYVFTERGSVLGEDIPVPAQTTEYEYERTVNGVKTTVAMTMWYLTGVYKVETTVILNDKESGVVGKDDITVQVPKTVTGSEIWFVGGYVAQDHSGSLGLVEDLTDAQPGSDFVLKVGTGSGQGQVTFEGGPVTAFPAETKKAGDGVLLTMSVGTNSGFRTSGFVGAVTLHMVEMLGSIPINMFDVEVDIYLRLITNDIEQTIVMRSKDGTYVGSTDAYLPVLSDNQTGLYHIVNGKYDDIKWIVGSINGTLSLNTVETNLNKNGWISSEWSDKPLESFPTGEPTGVDYGAYLGVGGVYAPVLRFSYSTATDPDADGNFAEMCFTVTVVNEVTGAKTQYTITLKPVLAHTVSVVFHDKYLETLETSSSVKWSGFTEILRIQLDFGTSLNGIYMAYIEDRFNQSFDGTKDYIDEFTQSKSEFIAMKGGAVLISTDKTSLEGQLAVSYPNVNYTVVTVEDFLEFYNDHKPNTKYDNGPKDGFDYSANDDWYDSESCLSRFFFASPISDDVLNVYAGYSIKVTVTPFYFDESGNPITTGLSVSPSLIMQGNPGEEIDLTEMLEGLSWTAGYELSSGYVWYTDSDHGLNPITSETGKHIVISPRADYELYLCLQEALYKVEVQVQRGSSASTQVTDFSMTVNGNPAGDKTGHYRDPVTVTLPDSYGDGGYHIDSVSGSTINGQLPSDGFTVSGLGVSFEMPNGDLTLVIHMTDLYRVTVTLATGGVTDNSKLSIGLDESRGEVRVTLSTAMGDKSDSVLVSGGTLVLPKSITEGRGVDIVMTGANGTIEVVEGKYVLGDLTGDVSFSIYVSMKWELTFEDNEYQLQRYPVDPVTGIVGSTSTTIDQSGVATVHTGDVLVPDALQGYSIDSVTADGATKGECNRFTVSGTIDVVFHHAERYWKLQVTVNFPSGTDVSQVTGGLKLDGLEWSSSVKGPATLSYGADVLAGRYEITGGFDGYILDPAMPHSFTVSNDTMIVITAQAAQFTIVFTDGSESINVDWHPGDLRTILAIYKDSDGCGNPAGWAGPDGIVMNGTVPNTGMFTGGKLELIMIPVISDIGQSDAEKISLVILRTDLTVGYEVGTEFDVSGVEVVSSELKVTVTCENGKITLKSTEGGTGTFTVFLEGEGRALILEVYVLEPVNIV